MIFRYNQIRLCLLFFVEKFGCHICSNGKDIYLLEDMLSGTISRSAVLTNWQCNATDVNASR